MYLSFLNVPYTFILDFVREESGEVGTFHILYNPHSSRALLENIIKMQYFSSN